MKAELTKSQKWKSPRIDKFQNIWLNTISSSHVTFTNLLKETMQNQEKTPEWMRERTTYLLTKSNDTKDPKNYRPIICLSTTYKLLTSVLTDRTYSQLEQNYLFPLEQKGCRRGSYGCKYQLMFNKMILENCKKRKQNLSGAWKILRTICQSISHSSWFSKT